MENNTIDLETAIIKALDKLEFARLCNKCYRDVVDGLFTESDAYRRKVEILVDYCERRGEIDTLVRRIQAINPNFENVKGGVRPPSPLNMLANCQVRIYSQDRSDIVGAGFVLNPHQVITCAHVVSEAIKGADHQLIGKLVNGDFPLFEKTESIKIFRVLKIDCDEVIDYALLGSQELLSPQIRHAAVGSMSQDLWGHEIRAFGFPANNSQGVWSDGKILGPNAWGWLQIQDISQRGHFIKPGFSGAPVWDNVLHAVVGMVVAAEIDPGLKAGYIIPISKLLNWAAE